MSTVDQIDFQELLRDTSPLVDAEIEAYEEIISGTDLPEFRKEVRAYQAELEQGGSNSPEALCRAGVCAYLLGEHTRAVAFLEQISDNPLALYYSAQALMALDQPEEAEKMFAQAAKKGYDKVECTLRQAGAVRQQGRVDEAEELVRSVSKEGAGRAEYSFQMGCIWADRGDTLGAVEYFTRAVDMDPHHSRALFWLAGENSSHGNDEEAIRLYEQSLSKPPHYMGALINLGLLYEDCENYLAAGYCFRRVLDADPNHQRAQLYLKDIEATGEQFYDEDKARQEARMEQLLKRPITDFELSVRARNCLQQMDIFTLGDLTKISENELLAGKNFGETSLHEIQELMQSHGLSIGEHQHQAKSQEIALAQQNLSPQEQAMLNKPISDLNLSVRARKCMTRLNITTVGELLQRTADELLGSRNFGVTSLNEIRQKLAEIDLKLRND